ncbi:unnamed protein product [Angiostrongylus costaricensis]|uniref:Uncharacterized protein n=1 Tax=Angiostrongylus costaricensis TaxID=334426 RepID=A0A0R3PFU1_ANGCS|nr:unnamed protein product [Angiostrongylus costaricensis]
MPEWTMGVSQGRQKTITIVAIGVSLMACVFAYVYYISKKSYKSERTAYRKELSMEAKIGSGTFGYCGDFDGHQERGTEAASTDKGGGEIFDGVVGKPVQLKSE